MQLRTPVPSIEGQRELRGSEHHLPFGQQPLLRQLKEVTEVQPVREAFLDGAMYFSPKHIRAKTDHQATGILKFTAVPKRALSIYTFLKHTSEALRKSFVIKDCYKT